MAQRRRRKSHRARTVLMVCAIICAAGASAMLYMRQKVTETYAEDSDSTAQSEVVETGSLSTTVSGSGTLEAVGLTEVTIPVDVDVSKIFYSAGAKVSEGDLLFSVDNASVLKAMQNVQNQIDTLDESLEEASADEVSSTLTSGVSGRVKKIYAAAEDDVSSVMYSSGALLTLSLDGYMAVDVQTDLLSADDSVTVTTSDGIAYTGTVDSVNDSTAVILVTDDGPTVDDTVTVSFEVSAEAAKADAALTGEETISSEMSETEASSEVTASLETTDTDGAETAQETELTQETELVTKSCTGTLYIHSPLSITGYAGTVESVDVSENESISADTSLMTLTDTSYSANYNTILAQREELEETLNGLIILYREGGVYAPISGKVSTISEAYEDYVEDSSTKINTSKSEESGSSEDQSGDADGSENVVLTLDPNEEMTVNVSVDETDILTMEVGQSASITIDSIGEDVYTGTVTSIDTSASSDAGVTAYTVEVTIPRTEQMLSGMSASVEIQIDGVEDAILVPAEAVHQTSSTSYVYTTYDEETKEFGGMTEVTTGLTDGSKTEITSGLKAGDTVWYEEAESLQESGGPGMNGNMGMDFGNMSPGGNSSQRPGGSSQSGSSRSSGSRSGNSGGGNSGGGAPSGGPGGN